jgi:hypothetical protein
MIGNDELLNTEQVSKLTGKACRTLAKERSLGTSAIPYVKQGKSVRYRRSDVDRYIASLRGFNSTSEYDRRGGRKAAVAPAVSQEDAIEAGSRQAKAGRGMRQTIAPAGKQEDAPVRDRVKPRVAASSMARRHVAGRRA